ncbi:MAG: hypothetical protein V7605_1019 [Acidimicrobiaceae bacterium]
MDGAGLALATGRPPRPPGAMSPAAALAAAPVATWPIATVNDDGRRVDVAAALGTGGARVAELLGRIAGEATARGGVDIARLAAATPAGPVTDPLALVSLAEAVEATAAVDRAWLDAVDRCRVVPRPGLEAAGRGTELEAGLHLAMLLATGPVDDSVAGVARVASGARLWLLGGAIAWALTGDAADPFACWAELVSYGLWPVGPVGGRLLVGGGLT